MINWIMDLISKSINDKSIHHFSLDFGSALLANIIHAPTTLAYLSSKPQYAQNVTAYSNIDDGNNAKIHERPNSSFSIYAYIDLLVLPIKIRIFQDSKIKL